MKPLLALFAVFLLSFSANTATAGQPVPSPNEPAVESSTTATNEQLAKEVKSRIGKTDITPLENAMTELLKRWKPVGKSRADLEALIGLADERDLEQMIYRFDNQLGGGSEWVFLYKDGKITSVSHQTLEK